MPRCTPNTPSSSTRRADAPNSTSTPGPRLRGRGPCVRWLCTTLRQWYGAATEQETTIAKNEKAGNKAKTIASKVLRTGKATKDEAKTLAGSVLTQAADKDKSKK